METKEAKGETELELEQLSNYNAELHHSCDFVALSDTGCIASSLKSTCSAGASALHAISEVFDDFTQQDLDASVLDVSTSPKHSQSQQQRARPCS